jgi:hypothetical protein
MELTAPKLRHKHKYGTKINKPIKTGILTRCGLQSRMLIKATAHIPVIDGAAPWLIDAVVIEISRTQAVE